MVIFVVSIQEYGEKREEVSFQVDKCLKDHLPAVSVESLVSMELIA